jgi:hypothetical protein
MKNSSRSSLKYVVVSLIVLGFMLVIGVSPTRAEAVENTSHFNFPVVPGTILTNPCNGDLVALTGGSEHFVVHFSQQPSGNVQFVFVNNAEDISGTSTTTGSNYRVTGVSISSVTVNSPQNESTVIVRNNLLGQGQIPNFHLDLTIHVTTDANGNSTANVASFSTSCQ